MQALAIRTLTLAAAGVVMVSTLQPAAAVEPLDRAAARPSPTVHAGRQDGAAAQMLAKARTSGRLRVIVGLKLGLTQGLSGAAAVAQSRTLDAAQSGVALRALGAAGAEGVVKFDTIPFVSLFVTADQLSKVLADAEVASVQEDVPVRPTLQDSVPLINGDDLVAKGVTGAGRVVAILDTGSQSTHPMLAGKVVSEACYSTNDPVYTAKSLCPGGATESTEAGSGAPCPSNVEGCFHGTHVASIAAGRSSILAGVAPGAAVVPIQVFSKFSSSDYCGSSAPCALSFSTDQIKGLERVLALKSSLNIDSANMSLGGSGYQFYCDANDPAEAAAINNLRAAGVATTIATGNSGYVGYISSPACIASAVRVGATTKSDALAYYSNNSPIVDLLAPGSDITAALPKTAYGALSGTSMAAPHVAGSFAILRDAKPDASVADILAALSCGGKLISKRETGEIDFAKPRIDLLAAFKLLKKGAKSDSWSFNNEKDARDWPPVLGEWTIANGAYEGTGKKWTAAATAGCAHSVRIRAAMSRVMNDRGYHYGSTGLIYKAAAAENGAFNGFFAGYNNCPTTKDGECTGQKGEKPGYAFLSHLSNANLAKSTGDATLLCSAKAPLNEGEANEIEIISTPMQQTYKFNGKTVCSIAYPGPVAGGLAAISYNASGRAKAFKIEDIEIDADEADVAAAAAEAARNAGDDRTVVNPRRLSVSSVRESFVGGALAGEK